MITILTWAASLPSPLLPLSLYSPRSMKDAAQGARFRVPSLSGCTINGRPQVTRPHAPDSCRIPKSNTNGVEDTGNRSRIRVQQGLPLQRGRYRHGTWELLFVLRVQGPAQGLCIHSETPSYIGNATMPASRSPCKDFTLPPPIFWEVCSRCPSTSIFFPPMPRFGFSSLIPGCRPSAVDAPF